MLILQPYSPNVPIKSTCRWFSVDPLPHTHTHKTYILTFTIYLRMRLVTTAGAPTYICMYSSVVLGVLGILLNRISNVQGQN